MSETTQHCQICARAIRAASGLIAHHGYRRPGHGWQTASCYGARRVPYEVGHDALDRWITDLSERYIPRTEARRDALLASPPDRFDVRRLDAHRRPVGPERWAERPANFVPVLDLRARRASYMPDAYDTRYYRALDAALRDLRDQRETLAYARERRAAWRAPQ